MLDRLGTDIGRRERKKAETRKLIADAALRLFLERGYDAVGVREVADEADVAVATLFAHFPSKEALVFGQDAEQKEALLEVVRGRPRGVSIPEALRRWCHAVLAESRRAPGLARYHQLVDSTPALRDYSAKMWLRHQQALAQAVATDIGLTTPDTACLLLARTTLEVLPMLRLQAEPARIIDESFTFIGGGWNAASRARARASDTDHPEETARSDRRGPSGGSS